MDVPPISIPKLAQSSSAHPACPVWWLFVFWGCIVLPWMHFPNPSEGLSLPCIKSSVFCPSASMSSARQSVCDASFHCRECLHSNWPENAIVERPLLLWSLVASIHSHFILGCWTTCPFKKELSCLKPSHDSLCKAHFRPCLCLLYTCRTHFHWLWVTSMITCFCLSCLPALLQSNSPYKRLAISRMRAVQNGKGENNDIFFWLSVDVLLQKERMLIELEYKISRHKINKTHEAGHKHSSRV